MKEKSLIPILEFLFQRDQAAVNDLQNQLSRLARMRMRLDAASNHDESRNNDIAHARSVANYLEWKQQEVSKISKEELDLTLRLKDKRRKLGKSFGRLEAMKEIVSATSR